MTKTKLLTPFVSKHIHLPSGFERMKDGERLKLAVTVADMDQFDALPQGISRATVWVKDLTSGRLLCLARANCIASCCCAAEIVGIR